jgi:polyketide cyclase/dehydrase/lipid transport protein
MPRAVVAEVIDAPSADVFDLVHDYGRRLEWDTLLSAAYLDDGFTAAGLGATSVCVGRRSLGRLAFKTVYVSFDRPRVAAVKLVNSPPFFDTWAASIRHEDLAPRRSRIVYTLQFSARPAALRWLLEPIMLRAFRRETAKRLAALRGWFQEGRGRLPAG